MGELLDQTFIYTAYMESGYKSVKLKMNLSKFHLCVI